MYSYDLPWVAIIIASTYSNVSILQVRGMRAFGRHIEPALPLKLHQEIPRETIQKFHEKLHGIDQ